MKLQTITQPAVEPVTLAEAKTHARIFADLTDDDAYVQMLIVTAREDLEGLVQRTFVSRQYRGTLHGFPCLENPNGPYAAGYAGYGYTRPSLNSLPIMLDRPPLVSVDAIEYTAVDGSTVTLDPSMYTASPGTPGLVAPALGLQWPTAADVLGAVRVTYTAGYSADASLVPSLAKMLIQMLAAHWYARREPIATGTVAAVPYMVDALADRLRWGAFPR